MKSLREIVRADPVRNDDGTYSPSKASLKVAVKDPSDYKDIDYPNAYAGGDKKILMLCTEDSLLECTNGKVFETGNHPAEVFVVLLHLEKAGFEIDVATITGRPVPIEEFAMPTRDEAVTDIRSRYADRLANPIPMAKVLDDLGDDSPYVGVYVPGGHGAVLGLPFSNETGSILRWFIDTDRYLITICHGPAALLSLGIGTDATAFPLRGYKMTAFNDLGDKMMTTIGYLPGPMPYFYASRLSDLGVDIVTKAPYGGTHVDRKLISGDSPMAANKLGTLAATTLLASLNAT